MTQPSRRKRRSRRHARGPFLGLAISLLGVGIFLLVLSGILRNQEMFATAGAGLFGPAWWAIGIGAAMLGIHVLAQRDSGASATSATDKNHRRPSRPAAAPAALKALIDDVERQEAQTGIGRSAPPISGKVLTAVTANTPPNTSMKEPHELHQRASSWGPAVFSDIEWRRFEAVCETLFAQAGFETQAHSHGADGGVDIWLHSKNAQGPVAVVQCKHWQGKPVGVTEMRALFGLMASHGLKRGTYATTSAYTSDAQAFAKANGINALDSLGLLALIEKRTPEQQAALLTVAYEGE